MDRSIPEGRSSRNEVKAIRLCYVPTIDLPLMPHSRFNEAADLSPRVRASSSVIKRFECRFFPRMRPVIQQFGIFYGRLHLLKLSVELILEFFGGR